jgi:hypothetical protein
MMQKKIIGIPDVTAPKENIQLVVGEAFTQLLNHVLRNKLISLEVAKGNLKAMQNRQVPVDQALLEKIPKYLEICAEQRKDLELILNIVQFSCLDKPLPNTEEYSLSIDLRQIVAEVKSKASVDHVRYLKKLAFIVAREINEHLDELRGALALLTEIGSELDTKDPSYFKLKEANLDLAKQIGTIKALFPLIQTRENIEISRMGSILNIRLPFYSECPDRKIAYRLTATTIEKDPYPSEK